MMDAIKGDGAFILEKIQLAGVCSPGGIEMVFENMKMFGEVKARRTGNILETWEALRRTEGTGLDKFIRVSLELCGAKNEAWISCEARLERSIY